VKARRRWTAGAGRSAGSGSGVVIQVADQSSGARRPVSISTGSLQGEALSGPAPQTRTRASVRCRDTKGAAGQGTKTDWSLSTRPVATPSTSTS
jgi:hypothetical protein